MANAHTIVLIPIYQPELSPLEAFSLDHSLPLLAGRTVRFIGPRGLAMDYYARRYPGIGFDAFDPAYFSSIQGYNLLLLDPGFYRYYGAEHEFMLILQTDAILLRDELDFWASQPYDYVGAPWPQGLQLRVALDCFEGERSKNVQVFVGNGGLSLRRNSACVALLNEFPQALNTFRRSGSSEDLFFAVMGSLSTAFVLPNERVASRFAWELQPEHYHAIDGQPPMGGHAWWKYSPAFWLNFFHRRLPAEALSALALSLTPTVALDGVDVELPAPAIDPALIPVLTPALSVATAVT